MGKTMKRHSWKILAGVIALLVAGCSQSPSGSTNGPKVTVKDIAIAPFARGSSLASTTHVVNSGNEAAMNVKIAVTGTGIIKGDAEPAGMDALPADAASLPDIAPQAMTELPAVNQRAIEDEGDMRNFISGQWVLWVIGRVEYDDAAKKHHVSNFRWYYDYETNAYKAADKGNDVN